MIEHTNSVTVTVPITLQLEPWLDTLQVNKGGASGVSHRESQLTDSPKHSTCHVRVRQSACFMLRISTATRLDVHPGASDFAPFLRFCSAGGLGGREAQGADHHEL